MLDQVINWLSTEPAAALMLIAAAAGVFIFRFRITTKPNGEPKAWDRRVLEAAAGALLLLAMAWAFRQMLNNVSDSFELTHGSATSVSRWNASALWGDAIRQRELVIYQEREIEITDQIPRKDPQKPAEYQTKTVKVSGLEHIITAFRGDVLLRLGEREKDGKRYSGYTADVTLKYDIQSQLDAVSRTVFDVSILGSEMEVEQVQVSLDGQPVALDLETAKGHVFWETNLAPRQASTVQIHYTATGTNAFVYTIPNDHLIHDYLLVITVDRLPVAQVAYPYAGLAPSEVRPSDDGRGSVLTWRMDRAANAADMGVSLPKAEQRGAQVLRALLLAPFTVCLLAGLLALSMLLWQSRVDFVDLAFFLALYTLECLILALVSDLFVGFWGGLAAALLLTLFLAYRWSRRMPAQAGGLRWLLLALYALFALLVPLTSQWVRAEQQNAVQAYLQVGLVLYLVILWLATRRQAARALEGG